MERIKSFAKSKGYIPIDVSSQLGDFNRYIKFVEKLQDIKYDKCLFIIDTELLGKETYEIYRTTLLKCDKHAYLFSNKSNTKIFFKDKPLENLKLSVIEELMNIYERNCMVCFEEYERMKCCSVCYKLICISCLNKLYDIEYFTCPHCRSL